MRLYIAMTLYNLSKDSWGTSGAYEIKDNKNNRKNIVRKLKIYPTISQ